MVFKSLLKVISSAKTVEMCRYYKIYKMIIAIRKTKNNKFIFEMFKKGKKETPKRSFGVLKIKMQLAVMLKYQVHLYRVHSYVVL